MILLNFLDILYNAIKEFYFDEKQKQTNQGIAFV